MNPTELQFSVAPEVSALGLSGEYLVIADLKNGDVTDEFDAVRKQTLDQLAGQYGVEGFVRDDPVLAGFRELHTRVGRSNRRFVSSPEALLSRFVRTGAMPRLSLLVDIYNLLSLRTRLALGAHDVARIDGAVSLRLTDGSESFRPLGAAANTSDEAIFPGEYGYVDDSNSVICRMEVLQVEKTKIETNTTAAFYIVQGNMNTPPESIAAAVDELVTLSRRFCGGEVVRRWSTYPPSPSLRG